MRIVAFSDTHGQHAKLNVPSGDVVVCAGDFSSFGKWTDAEQFLNWFSRLPHKHKLLICGNHEVQVERDMSRWRAMIPHGILYLHDSSVTIDGVKFYGSPYTPRFFDWAFNADRGEALAEIWRKVPDDTDVLITHGPPLGICDLSRFQNARMGDLDLLNRIQQLDKLKVHIFGHNHSGYGSSSLDGKRFENVAVCDEEYRAVNQPTVIEV